MVPIMFFAVAPIVMQPQLNLAQNARERKVTQAAKKRFSRQENQFQVCTYTKRQKKGLALQQKAW